MLQDRSVVAGGRQQTSSSGVDLVNIAVGRDVSSDGSFDVGIQHAQYLGGVRVVHSQEATCGHLSNVYGVIWIISASTLFGGQGISSIYHFQQSTGSVFFLLYQEIQISIVQPNFIIFYINPDLINNQKLGHIKRLQCKHCLVNQIINILILKTTYNLHNSM